MSDILLDRQSRVLLSEALQLEWLVSLCKLAWQLRPMLLQQQQPPQTHELNKLILRTLGEFGRLSESPAQQRIFDELQTATISLFCATTPNGKLYHYHRSLIVLTTRTDLDRL